MSTHNGAQWVMVSDQDGVPYWQRRVGGVVATVMQVILNGETVWRYDAGFEKWTATGYKDTIRAAKVAATKVLYWYALREQDFKRVQSKLRLLWEAQGLREVEPVRGNAWDVKADKVLSEGILWRKQHDRAVWESGAWQVSYNRATGWTLIHPDGYAQTIHQDSRYDAMKEAAFWIELCLAER